MRYLVEYSLIGNCVAQVAPPFITCQELVTWLHNVPGVISNSVCSHLPFMFFVIPFVPLLICRTGAGEWTQCIRKLLHGRIILFSTEERASTLLPRTFHKDEGKLVKEFGRREH